MVEIWANYSKLLVFRTWVPNERGMGPDLLLRLRGGTWTCLGGGRTLETGSLDFDRLAHAAHAARRARSNRRKEYPSLSMNSVRADAS